MNKDVRLPIVAAEKPVALGIIEPLHRTFQTFHVPPSFCGFPETGGRNPRDRKIMHALCGGRGGLSRKQNTKMREFV
jgi:hypothetical protein